MKNIFLILMFSFLFIPGTLFCKTSPEIIQEKIIQMYSQIKTQWQKTETITQQRTVLCLGFWSTKNQILEKKIGLLLSRYLFEYLNQDGFFQVLDQDQMLELLKPWPAEEIIQLTPKFIQHLKQRQIYYIILGSVTEDNTDFKIQYQFMHLDQKRVLLNQTDLFSKKISDDLSAAYQIDRLGLLYQDTFDFNTRFFIGPAWYPLLNPTQKNLGRTLLHFGYDYSAYNAENTSKNRFKFFSGQVSLSPLSFDLLAFEYDKTFIRYSPLFWITTFAGSPERFDVTPDGGFSLQVFKIQYHPLQSLNYSRIETLSCYQPFHLWQSRDLMNYLRLRVGPGLGFLFSESKNDRPLETDMFLKGIFEGHFILDAQGFHTLRFSIESVLPYDFKNYFARHSYFNAQVSYETIFMRISEQPVSLYIKALGAYRNDIKDAPAKGEISLHAGLNFSFSVPPLAPVLSEFQLRKQNVLK